jgi:peptide deformylase
VIREIVIWPDPVLKRKCDPVEKVDDSIKQLLLDMEQTMLAARGAGLAAPQVGYALRLVTILVQNQEAKPDGVPFEVLKLVNPVIVERKGMQIMREGCLSLPGYFEDVKRATWVKVEALDENGQKVEVAGDGKLAQALQHELEHLDGIVFADHLSLLKRNRAITRFKKAKAKGMRYVSDRPEPRDFTQLDS